MCGGAQPPFATAKRSTRACSRAEGDGDGGLKSISQSLQGEQRNLSQAVDLLLKHEV